MHEDGDTTTRRAAASFESAARDGGAGRITRVGQPDHTSSASSRARVCEASVEDGAAPTPLRVLLIEDNPDAAESLRLLLAFRGHEVRVAECGRTGISLAREFVPDAVVCDVGLPGGLSGYDVARALRDDDRLRGCQLVALSGHGRVEDRVAAAEAGFDVHLTKPVDFGRLAAALTGRAG